MMLLTKTLTSRKEILDKTGANLEDNWLFHADIFSEDSPTYHLSFLNFFYVLSYGLLIHIQYNSALK